MEDFEYSSPNRTNLWKKKHNGVNEVFLNQKL